MDRSVGESLAGFEKELYGFSASKSVSRIGCIGFVSGEFARLATSLCDAWEKLRVHQESHCQGDRGKEGTYKLIDSVVGQNFEIELCLPQNLCVCGGGGGGGWW